jgi:alkylation response protein AidB-like acyl-CoA dehydrogenase
MDQLAVAAAAHRTDTPLITNAKALAPLFRDQAAKNEAAGKLTDETIAALRSGDFFGLMVPKCFGGAEVGPVEALEVYEIISEADSSTGWVLMAANVGTGSAAGYLPPKGAQAVFGNRIPIIAGEGGPRGRAEVDGRGGYRLTGRWSYGSGVLHAEYLHTGAMVVRNGEPRMLPGTKIPEARTFIVPIGQAKMLGNWDVLGLVATASVDYALEDVYVPKEFTHSPNALVAQQGGNLYKIGIVGMSPLGHAGVALGIGRRVLDELRALANAPAGRPSALAERGGGESFQEQFAAAEAKLRAGRAFCYEVWARRRGDARARRRLLAAPVHVDAAFAQSRDDGRRRDLHLRAQDRRRGRAALGRAAALLPRHVRRHPASDRVRLHAARVRPRASRSRRGQDVDQPRPRRSAVGARPLPREDAGDGLGQLVEVVDETRSADLVVGLAGIAEGHADRRHARSRRGRRVGDAVADHDRAARIPAEAAHRLEQRLRVRLLHRERVARDDHGEVAVEPEALEHQRCQPPDLVGADGEPDTRRRRPFQLLDDTRPQRRPVGAVRLVVDEEMPPHLLEPVRRDRAPGPLERAPHHLGRAAADQGLDAGFRHRRAPLRRQHDVERRAQVRRRVGEGPVEVEQKRER